MDYISIRVSTIRGDQQIGFNTYIKINEKMLLYLKKGDSFEGDRLKKLKEKKLRKMFILQSEEPHYRDYLEKNISIAYDNNSGKDLQTRAEIIQGSQQSNTEELMENPDSVEAYNTAKDAAGKYVDFLLTNSQAINSIMNIQNVESNLAHHGVSVATLSVALANKLGIKDPKQTQLLTLGALLHDFGHIDSTIDYKKQKKQMTPEELRIYLNHPQLGAEKVRDKKHFDQTVINIIKQHEELIDGSGPEKLLEKSTDPLAVIVSSANALDRLITYEGIPKNEAAKYLMMNAVGAHPLKHIQLLGEILKES